MGEDFLATTYLNLCLQKKVSPELLDQSAASNRLDESDLIITSSYSAPQTQISSKVKFTKVVKSFYQLFETMIRLDKAQLLESLKGWAAKVLEPEILKRLINEFLKDFAKFSSHRPVIELIEARTHWLDDFLQTPLEFSWKMSDAKCYGHDEIEDFLRSEQTKYVYVDAFANISEAREFATEYDGLQNGYSVRMVADGHGKKAYVKIFKTKDFYYQLLSTQAANQKENLKLKKVLGTKTSFLF